MYYKIITSSGRKSAPFIKEVWQYRSLLFALAKRDILSNYAETRLGFLWSIIQPLIGLLIFTFFFEKIIKINTGSVPYPLFALSGMSAWYYFVFIVNNAGSSVIQMQHIIKKMSFPKVLCPLSKVLSGLLDFVITLFLLLITMMFYSQVPPLAILVLPVIIVLLIITGLSLGIWIAALTVRYRDLLHVVPYLMSFAIWITPVFYPATILPEKYSGFMYLNPMAALCECLRWSVLGGGVPDMRYMISFIPVIILFAGGIFYFRSIENKIAELI